MIRRGWGPAACGTVIAVLLLCSLAWGQAADQPPLDVQQAQQLFRRFNQGEKLSVDEEAYLERARREIRKRREQAGKSTGAPVRSFLDLPTRSPTSSTGLLPLTELGTNQYKDEDGGLYGGGSNQPPAEHRAAVEKELSRFNRAMPMACRRLTARSCLSRSACQTPRVNLPPSWRSPRPIRDGPRTW